MTPAHVIGNTGDQVQMIGDGESAIVFLPTGEPVYVNGMENGFAVTSPKVVEGYYGESNKKVGFQLKDGGFISSKPPSKERV